MAVFLLIGVFFLAREGAEMAAGENKDYDYTVVLDPGHGGSDPGKVGVHKEQEKEINLQIALLVKEILEQKEVKVIMTRESDKGLADESTSNKKVQDLKRRCSLIHEVQPDCVISIHQNSFTDTSSCGPQVFYYGASEESKTLAIQLQNALDEALEVSDSRGIKCNNGYYIFKNSPAPIVIVECGFLSNSNEADLLATDAYQSKLARTIYEGVCRYLGFLQTPSSSASQSTE